MNKRKKRVRRLYKYHKKYNFHLLNKISRILSWLLPGLVIKRCMLTSAIGFLTALLGLSIWTNLSPLYWFTEIFFGLLTGLTKILPVSVLGPLIFVIGIILIGIGQNRSINSIQKALVPEKNTFLVDALRVKSKLNRGPNIVAIGGGTGLSTLLKGLKNHSSNITAIVTVSDDGGSSGSLRKQLGVQPPGDIRNCLAALSNEEPILTRLFQYRFSEGSGLEGHSFGNLFLSALTTITGSLEKAVQASSKVLAVQGQVLPATNIDVMLWAELEDGEKIFGESKISKSKKDNQVFVGFCAFTGSIEEARMTIKEKIIQKGCDYLFANPIDLEGQGFGFLAQNEGWLFDTNNMEHYINKTSKIDLANKLITQIISLKK